MNTIKVLFSNLHFNFSQRDAELMFEKFKPQSVKLIETKGYGFIEIDEADASVLIREMNRSVHRGRKLYVQISQPNKDVSTASAAAE